MYVHIGGEYQISARTILMILNLDHKDGFQPNSINHHFMKMEEDKNRIEFVEMKIPRSLVLTLDRSYLTPISAATLRERWKMAYRRKVHRR